MHTVSRRPRIWHRTQRPHASTRRQARVAALLLVAGALLASLTLALPHWRGTNDTAIAALALVAFVAASGLAARGDRLPPGAFHAVTAAGTLLISAGLLFAGAAAMAAYAALYLWVVLYAFAFFSRGAAVAHTSAVATAYAVALATRGTQEAAAQWLLQIGTMVVAGFLLGFYVESAAAAATTDTLTGLANRRWYEQLLRRELARSRRTGESLSVALIDLDDFKVVNDDGGHGAGDSLLRLVASGWRAHVRQADLLARYGGDEFALLLTGCPGAQAADLVGRLCADLPDGRSCSAGIATWNGREHADELVSRADAALYEAKRRGRNQAVRAADG